MNLLAKGLALNKLGIIMIRSKKSHVIFRAINGLFSGKVVSLEIFKGEKRIGVINELCEIDDIIEEHYTEYQRCSMTAELFIDSTDYEDSNFELGTDASGILDDLEAYTGLQLGY